MDLLTQKLEDTAFLPIKDLYGNPTDFVIELFSPDSKEFNAARHRKFKVLADIDNKDVEALERSNLELLADCTASWQNAEEGGKEIKFSRKEAIRLYKEYPFIKEQVDRFVGDRLNFLTSA